MAQAGAAKPPSCPNLSDAQIRVAVGVKPASLAVSTLGSGTIATGGGNELTCQWVLGTEPSITLKVYKGSAALSELVKQISSVEGINNGSANANLAPPTVECSPKFAGYCQGPKFDEHLSPVAGIGEKAYDDPGGPADGANVEFAWKGNTYALRSSGPYGVPGPDLAKVLAFARLIVRSGYTP